MRPDAIVLFSGGLDSLLAARMLQEQGLAVHCLHFCSPFFGSKDKVDEWSRLHGLAITVMDIADEFVAMLRQRPAHGFGKGMNPCVDCKILQLVTARKFMEKTGASFLATGEVLGQRPMSQRRDTLALILRDAGVRDILLRPLSARLLEPVAAERSGLVDRERLGSIWGRGRKDQLALAAKYELAEIPSPGGGCRLTEHENIRRYWPVLTRVKAPDARDFALANAGRQFWFDPAGGSVPVAAKKDDQQIRGQDHASAPGPWSWLAVGRNEKDNQAIAALQRPGDAMLELVGLPGPLGLARSGQDWPQARLAEAAMMVAACSPRAVATAQPVEVRITAGDRQWLARVGAKRPDAWSTPAWEDVKAELKAEARARLAAEGKHSGDQRP